MLAHKHDVVAVVPEDRAETELPAGSGYLHMRDVESGRRVSVGLGRQARAGYAAADPPSGAKPWRARSTACRWTTCSCRRPAVRCCRCCRCLPGERRDPPSAAAAAARAASRRGARRGRAAGPGVSSVDRTAVVGRRPRHLHGRHRLRAAAWTSCSTTSRRRSCASTGCEIVGSDSSATTGRRRAHHPHAALRADDLPRRHAVAVDRADLGALLRSGARGSGCRTWRRPARCRSRARRSRSAARCPRTSRPTRCATAVPRRRGIRSSSRAGSIGLALVVRVARAGAVSGRGRRPAPRRRAHRPPVGAPEPCTITAPTLERLRALDVTTEDDRRRAYDEISTAVREHVAARAGVPAPSLTAAEIDAALAQRRAAGSRARRSARCSPTATRRATARRRRCRRPQACRDALSTAEQVLAQRRTACGFFTRIRLVARWRRSRLWRC